MLQKMVERTTLIVNLYLFVMRGSSIEAFLFREGNGRCEFSRNLLEVALERTFLK